MKLIKWERKSRSGKITIGNGYQTTDGRFTIEKKNSGWWIVEDTTGSMPDVFRQADSLENAKENIEGHLEDEANR